MHLTKNTKILIGIATLAVVVLPFIMAMGWMAMMFLPFFSVFSEDPQQMVGSFALMFGAFFIVMPLMFLMAIMNIGLQIFYIIHVIKNERGDDTIRILSAIGFFFKPYIAFPIYYFLYIWPETPPPSALKPAHRPFSSGNTLIGANS